MSYQIVDLLAQVEGTLNLGLGINNQHPQGIQAGPWPPQPSRPEPLPVGQVVGIADKANNRSAFRWDENAGPTDVGALSPGVNTWAYAINDSSLTVGWWNGGGVNSQALMWAADFQITALSPLLAPNVAISNAYDINSSGRVTGRARLQNADRFRGFILDVDKPNVTWIDGPNSAHVFPHAINDHGAVVGQVGNDSNINSPLSAGANVPFLWTESGGIQTLFDKGTGSAFDINDAGYIVGIHFEKDENEISLPRGAFVRKPDGSVSYPGLGLGGFRANAINDNNEVVGHAAQYHQGDTYNYASIYDRRLYSGDNVGLRTGTFEDLNSLISPVSGWHLIEAYDVNNAGQIVGAGFNNGVKKPFLLVPNFVADDPFRLEAVLASTLLGGIAQDGGGIVIKPGGVGGPVPPWGPIAEILSAATRDDAAMLAVRAAIELTNDESLRSALREVLKGHRRL